jgi:hypothetical protein
MEVLAASGARVTYVGCPADPSLRAGFLHRSVPLGQHGECRDFADAFVRSPDVRAGLPEWTLWLNDLELRRVARSDLTEAERLRILPTRKAPGLAALGSKAGLAELARDAGVLQPRFEVVRSPAELADVLARWPLPCIVKADSGAGGRGLLRVRTPALVAHVRENPVPAGWAPLLVQEWIEGREASVEALFAHGRLAGWQYSRPLASLRPLAPHTAKAFFDPPSLDFVDALDTLARAAGLHGIANCTFQWSPELGRHFLLEADLRANAWHQFGPRLGVDWAILMAAARSDADAGAEPRHPRLGPGVERPLHLYPREPGHAIAQRDWTAAWPWLRRAPGTWDMRNHADRAVNRAERGELWAEVAVLRRKAVHRLTGRRTA